MPRAYLAWISGGFPSDFRARVRTVPDFRRTVVVAGDTRWMTASHAADGAPVDSPSPPFAVPIDAFSVNPTEYAPFLPRALRDQIVTALNEGKAVLGTTSAHLRRLGVGGSLTFGEQTVTVGAVVPDDAAGWSEMLVSRDVGDRLGIVDERYLLALVDGSPPQAGFGRLVAGLLPEGTPLRVVEPGGSRFMRVASGVNPPVMLKEYFGEFTAHPEPGNPAALIEDPQRVATHIQTRTVPLLGRVTCNLKLFPPLIAALHDVQNAGIGRPDPHELGVLERSHGGAQPHGAAVVPRLRRGGGHQRVREPLRRHANDGPEDRPDLPSPRLRLGRRLPDPRRHALRVLGPGPHRVAGGGNISHVRCRATGVGFRTCRW